MRYREAREAFQRGLQRSVRAGDWRLEVRFLANLGNCGFAVQEYRTALRFYMDASKLADKAGDADLRLGLASNISSLYLQLGDVNASVRSVERGLGILRRHGGSPFGPRLLMQAAGLHARKGDMRTALTLFGEAMDQADRRGDTATVAFAWDQLGYQLLQRGELKPAEEALLEAFRLRKLDHLPELQYSYFTVGMLRMAQGDLDSASRLLDEAVRLAAQSPGTLPLWRLYSQRGRLRLLQGRLEPSLNDLQVFQDHARRVWLEFLTADSTRTSMEGELHQAYSAFVTVASNLYFTTGREDLARRAFEAAEANRAVSLLAWMSTPAGWRERLPAEYWETLAQLQGAQAVLLRTGAPQARERVDDLLYRLTEMEALTGLELPAVESTRGGGLPRDLLARTRGALRSDEALISFHLGERESYRWVVTRERFQLSRLPARSEIAPLVRQFGGAVRHGSPDAGGVGGRLYSALFGGSPDASGKSNWLLALDGVLFELPVAALVAAREQERPVHLIERHSLRLLPSASMLASRSWARRDGPFLGLADAVYNTADPRWRGRSPARGTSGGGLLAHLPDLFAAGGKPVVQLPRLAGSAREIESCSRIWQPGSSGAVLLRGVQASREKLAGALRAEPAVFHVAAHFLQASQPDEQAVIALSLGPDGEPEFLTPAEISRWRCRVGLVVLSGCASGQAAALPGTGLVGMTRAWLAAGADSVVASLWPTPDDQGEMFVSFYGHLRRLRAAGRPEAEAEALRQAQVDMLHSGSWRSGPKYWASFFIVGKE